MRPAAPGSPSRLAVGAMGWSEAGIPGEPVFARGGGEAGLMFLTGANAPDMRPVLASWRDDKTAAQQAVLDKVTETDFPTGEKWTERRPFGAFRATGAPSRLPPDRLL